MQLDGKVAFITGGGGGIGAGIGEALIEQGMKVVLADIDLDHAQEEANRLGANAVAVQLDVTSLDSWAAAKAAAERHFGTIDVLCNNAGISMPRQPLDQVSPERFARVMAINVTGVFNGIHLFAPEMKRRRSGHIVNTASMNGLLPFATFAAYSASKFAVAGLSEALRDELAPFEVGVSILYPGLTRSRMSEGDLASGDISAETLKKGMMEPIWLGRAVARAVEQNQLHIITHPLYKAVLAGRFQEILDAHGEPAQPGYKGLGG